MGSFWSQPIRVECTDKAQLITCRTINSALWFVNNRKLEYMLLAYLAKYAEKYGVLLYAFTVVGNHYHMVARFPHGQRSQFFRDFNARVAESVRHCVPNYLGGPLFERRFTPQVLALDTDVENYFYYCALQAVSSGLCKKTSDYSDYNSFQDAANDRVRVFKLFSYGNTMPQSATTTMSISKTSKQSINLSSNDYQAMKNVHESNTKQCYYKSSNNVD